MSHHRRPAAALAPSLGSGKMFDAIADRYDLLNRLTALGMDQRWRRRTIAAIAGAAGERVLDVATGTGDLALATLLAHPDTEVCGLDPSPRMLALCQQKAESLGVAGRLTLVAGDAQALPYPDRWFAATTIGFGIRNVPDRQRGLSEMARVTRLGGTIAILELSEPRGLLATPARLYLHHVVPRLGGLLSGTTEYRYLQSSVAQFPPPEQFATTIRESGIDLFSITPMCWGTCHLFLGTPRPPRRPSAPEPRPL